jgi:hypothetical protein
VIKNIITVVFLLFTLTFYSQEESVLKKEVEKLIRGFNTNNKKVITNCVYPKVFENGLSPMLFEVSLAGVAALDRGESILSSENKYEIKNIANRKFCVVDFSQSKSEILKMKKSTTKEDLEAYIADRKKQIEGLGYQFNSVYDEKMNTLVETIIINNKIIGIADEVTKNKWKFLFSWNMYEPAKVEEIFGNEVKKELGL